MKRREKLRKPKLPVKSDNIMLVNKLKLLSVVDKLKRSRKILKDPYAKVYNKNCFQQHNQLRWESPLLIVRYVRQCIVTQNWDSLSSLILHLIRKKIHIYSSYIREMAFLAMLMSDQRDCQELLQDFIRLCFVRVPNTVTLSKYDVWFMEENKSE